MGLCRWILNTKPGLDSIFYVKPDGKKNTFFVGLTILQIWLSCDRSLDYAREVVLRHLFLQFMKNKTFNFRSLRCSCKFVYVCTQFVVVFLTFNGHQNPRPGLTRLLHTPCWSFPLAQHWFLSQSPSDEQNPGWGLQNPPTQWSPSLQSYLLLHWRFLHLSTKAETLTRINLWITTLFLEKIYKAGWIIKKLY